MDKSKLIWFGLGILAGIIFAPQIQKLPLVSKLPQV